MGQKFCFLKITSDVKGVYILKRFAAFLGIWGFNVVKIVSHGPFFFCLEDLIKLRSFGSNWSEMSRRCRTISPFWPNKEAPILADRLHLGRWRMGARATLSMRHQRSHKVRKVSKTKRSNAPKSRCWGLAESSLLVEKVFAVVRLSYSARSAFDPWFSNHNHRAVLKIKMAATRRNHSGPFFFSFSYNCKKEEKKTRIWPYKVLTSEI